MVSRSLLLSSALVVLLCASLAAGARDKLSVQLNDFVVSQPIPPNFASFSYEISGVLSLIGNTTAKPSYLQLLENLRAPSGAEGPQLRIGGNSADVSWWNPNHLPRPTNITYDITYTDLYAYRNFLRAAPHSSFVIDTSLFRAGNASWAVDHLQALQAVVGWDQIAAVEIGNEVDLFMENGIRPPTYNYSDYSRDFGLYVRAVYSQTTIPTPLIQGATFCCARFNNGIDDYMHAYRQYLKTFSYHIYPQSTCNGNIPQLSHLMSNNASDGEAARMLPFVKIARSLGIAYVMGETNSASCGGKAGISDILASALWAVDYMFALAAVNISMANFHGGSAGAYTPIGYHNVTTPDVRPLYYGMLLFSEAIANGSAILNTTVSTTNPLIKAWAVQDREGVHRVVVVHKGLDELEDCNVTVAPFSGGGSGGSATLARLHAPQGDYSSKYGLEWAGQTFDGTMDGRPLGARKTEAVPFAQGMWSFSLRPGTAAMLVLPQS